MEKELLKTADLTLASTLLCLGFDVLGLDNSNPKRINFFFEDTQETRDSVAKFWNNEIVVNPLELSNSRRELLTRINEA